MTTGVSISKVKKFISSNDNSPVISGSVLDLKRGGGIYYLEDGSIFKLTVYQCRMLPEGYPKWKN